jgi:hypothetical protein
VPPHQNHTTIPSEKCMLRHVIRNDLFKCEITKDRVSKNETCTYRDFRDCPLGCNEKTCQLKPGQRGCVKNIQCMSDWKPGLRKSLCRKTGVPGQRVLCSKNILEAPYVK